jgi:hypothetical protein
LSGRGILEERIALDEFGESMSGYGIPRTFSTINDRVNLIPTYHLASSNSVFSHDYVSMEAESGTVAMLDLRDQFFLYTQKDYRVSFEYRSDGDVTSCDSSEIEMSSEPIPSHDYIYDEIAYSATFSSELKDQTSCRVYEFVVDQLLRDHTECAQLCASHFACTHYEFHNNTYSPTCYAVDRTCDVTEDPNQNIYDADTTRYVFTMDWTISEYYPPNKGLIARYQPHLFRQGSKWLDSSGAEAEAADVQNPADIGAPFVTGGNVLELDQDESISFPFSNTTNQGTIFLTARCVSTEKCSRIFSDSADPSVSSAAVGYYAGYMGYFGDTLDESWIPATLENTEANTDFHTVAISWTSDDTAIYFDGQQIDSIDSFSLSLSGIRVNGQNCADDDIDGTCESFWSNSTLCETASDEQLDACCSCGGGIDYNSQIELGEVLMYDETLSDARREIVNTYLKFTYQDNFDNNKEPSVPAQASEDEPNTFEGYLQARALTDRFCLVTSGSFLELANLAIDVVNDEGEISAHFSYQSPSMGQLAEYLSFTSSKALGSETMFHVKHQNIVAYEDGDIIDLQRTGYEPLEQSGRQYTGMLQLPFTGTYTISAVGDVPHVVSIIENGVEMTKDDVDTTYIVVGDTGTSQTITGSADDVLLLNVLYWQDREGASLTVSLNAEDIISPSAWLYMPFVTNFMMENDDGEEELITQCLSTSPSGQRSVYGDCTDGYAGQAWAYDSSTGSFTNGMLHECLHFDESTEFLDFVECNSDDDMQKFDYVDNNISLTKSGLCLTNTEEGYVMLDNCDVALKHEIPTSKYLWQDEPIIADALRLATHTPQVIVRSNYVLAMNEDTDLSVYLPTEDVTPLGEGISPSTGKEGTEITISLNSKETELEWIYSNIENNKLTVDSEIIAEVYVAGAPCNISAASVDEIVCTLDATPAGVHDLIVRTPVGDAFFEDGSEFSASLAIDSIFPLEGSVIGGTVLTITGHGFGLNGIDNNITVGGIECIPRIVDNCHCDGLKYEGYVNCDIDYVYGYTSAAERHYARYFDFSHSNIIECVIANGTESEQELLADVVVTINNVSATASQQFYFSEAATPVINAISGPTASGIPLELTGYNLNASEVTDHRKYMDIWGFYQSVPNVTVWFDTVDYSMIFGTTLCYVGDVTTEDGRGINQYWGIAPQAHYDTRTDRPVATSDNHIICTADDLRDGNHS